MRAKPPTPRRIAISALAALTVGLGAVSLIAGFSQSPLVRVLQGLAVFAAGVVIIGGVAGLVMIRLAGWRDPISEDEFDAIVERAERLAAEDSWGDTEEYERDDADEDLFDPYDEDDFKALVRSAVDDLPLEFHRALEHVALVVSESGRRRGLYGLYEGGTV
ncbi:MAG TPA: hypothetical protein VMP89_03710, partial [Solirubrobacteraceae bacterium]|nr:hypothetical protein [Solirubrobacteraceae bacterium]